MGKEELLREELFALVWKKSTVEVAKELGVSDVAVAFKILIYGNFVARFATEEPLLRVERLGKALGMIITSGFELPDNFFSQCGLGLMFRSSPGCADAEGAEKAGTSITAGCKSICFLW